MIKYALLDYTKDVADEYDLGNVLNEAIKKADYHWRLLKPSERNKREVFCLISVDVPDSFSRMEDELLSEYWNETVKDYKKASYNGQFERGDVVLVRDHTNQKWEVAIYFDYDEVDGYAVCHIATDSELIPYFHFKYCKPYNKEDYIND